MLEHGHARRIDLQYLDFEPVYRRFPRDFAQPTTNSSSQRARLCDQTLQVSLGIAVPGVEDWFGPFNHQRVVHPYAETKPRQQYSMQDRRRRLDEIALDPSVLAPTDVIDSPAPLSGLTPISQLVAQARHTGSRHDADLWIADTTDPEGSYAELVRMTTLSEHESGWINWEPHEHAETVRTDRVITFSPVPRPRHAERLSRLFPVIVCRRHRRPPARLLATSPPMV